MPRMRTAAGILTELKNMDPNTQVSQWFIRQLICSGTIPVLTIGRKKLVNLDAVLEALTRGGEPQNNTEIGKIREVKI